MRAVVMTDVGGPEVLKPMEIERPDLSRDDEVLVRLHAAGVNPIDTKLRSRGTYYPQQMPALLGCDGAGTIEAVGAAVSRFRPGDEVYYCYGGIGGAGGSYAEYALLPEGVVAHKSSAVDFATAAATPLVLITAWESLHDRAHIEEGQRVLIHAGAGGVGHVAIQLARLAGCRVITTVGSAAKADFVRQLGADEVILYHERDFVEEALAWSGGEGVDTVFDTVGGATFEQSFAATRPYGRVVSLLQPAADCDWTVARLRNLTTSLELMLSPMYFGWESRLKHHCTILEQGSRLFDSGRLKIHLAATLPLEEAAEAHRMIEKGGMQGKIALRI